MRRDLDRCILNAEILASNAHRYQKDRAGVDYFKGHVLSVFENTQKLSVTLGLDEATRTVCLCTALLHDVVEDTPVTQEFIDNNYPVEVAEAVKAITKVSGEPYVDYIKRVESNYIAAIVKLADMNHNMDLTRNTKTPPTQRDIERTIKYVNATAQLLNHIIKSYPKYITKPL